MMMVGLVEWKQSKNALTQEAHPYNFYTLYRTQYIPISVFSRQKKMSGNH